MTVTVYKGGKCSGKTLTMLEKLNDTKGTFLCSAYADVDAMREMYQVRFPNVTFMNAIDYKRSPKYQVNGTIGLDLSDLRSSHIYITDFEYENTMIDLSGLGKPIERKKMTTWSSDGEK